MRLILSAFLLVAACSSDPDDSHPDAGVDEFAVDLAFELPRCSDVCAGVAWCDKFGCACIDNCVVLGCVP